jgi:hypothetical protein
MSIFFKSIADAINLTNVANASNALNKYSKHIAAIILIVVVYQLYLATFMRENFDSASKSGDNSKDNSKDASSDSDVISGTSCTQFTSCSDCTSAQIDRTDAGCFWNPTCKKCGSFKDDGYFSTCDAKKDPNIKCSPDSDPRPTPQIGDSDSGGGGVGDSASGPAPYDDSILNSNIGINVPLPYNDFDGAKSIVGGAAGSENGCPVCPKLTLLKGPTYTTA